MFKEDFAAFAEIIEQMTDFILNNKGEEVISKRHQKDFKKGLFPDDIENNKAYSNYTDVNFDDI